MTVGALYQLKENPEGLCEIVNIWHKPDIDPDCPESVLIVPMVTYRILSTDKIGKTVDTTMGLFKWKWRIAQ